MLLSDNDFCDKISKSTDTFIVTNISVIILGDIKSCSALFLIHFTRIVIRKNSRKVSILKLDTQYTIDPCPGLYKKRLDLQSEFNLLSTKMAERLLLNSRGLSYEYGDKNSRLLACQLKRQAASRLIPQIKNGSNNLVSNPQDVN